MSKSKINELDGLSLVWVPAGSFLMGAPATDTLAFPNEKPQVRVNLLNGYWITATPVTQAAYMKIMGENSVRSTIKGDNYPVTDVTLDEAWSYTQKVGGRLPTEAEWEWAARGCSENNRYDKPRDYGWFDKNSKGALQPVAKKKPNALGIYDMLGNVVELTCTPWSFALIGGDNPGLGDSNFSTERVTKSGSWWNKESGMSATSRSGSGRNGNNPPRTPGNNIGFRYVIPG
jgi:formylglycine-generating enzyme required for sulfatase activity